MAIVGSARVVITADTSRLEASVRDAFSRIDFGGMGDGAADQFADSYDAKMQQRMQQSSSQHGNAYRQGFSNGLGDIGGSIDRSMGRSNSSSGRRGRDAGDAFGQNFEKSLKKFEKNKKQAPFEGLITGLMENIHQIATQGIGLSAVAGVLYQVGAAVVAIGASAGGAVPSLAALGNVFGAVLQGAVVAKSAFKGVGAAIGALDKAQSAANQTADDAAERALQVAQARLSLKRATLEAGRAEEDQRVALERAQRSYQDALDNERKAQENVTEARKNATEKIIDMKFALEDSVLSEERAVLNLKKAEKALAQARAGGNQNAIYEADLAYREQELSLRKLREENNRLNDDAEKTFKEGVEGNEDVKDSLKAQERAIIAVADAQRALNREMEDGPLRTEQALLALQQAQMALKKAMEPPNKTAVDALNDAMAKLHPNAQWFAKFYQGTIKPFMDDMSKKAQGLFFEGFNQAVLKLWNSDFPDILERAYTLTAFTMGNIANSIAGAFTAEPKMDGLKSNLEYLENILMSNVTILSSLGEGAKNLVSPLLQIGDSLAPIAKDMAAGFAEAARSFADFVGEAKATGELDAFLQRSYQRLINLKDAFKSFGTGVKEYFGLAAEGGDIFVAGLEEIGRKWSESFKDPEKIERLRQSFKNAAENALTLMEIIGNIMGAFSQLGTDNSMGNLLEAVKELTESEVFTEALVMGAGAFMEMLTQIVEALGPMMMAFAEMQTLEHFFNWVGNIFEIIGKMVGFLANNPMGKFFLKATGYVVAFSLVMSLLAGIVLTLVNRFKKMQAASGALRGMAGAVKAKVTGGPAPESSGRQSARRAGADTADGFGDGVRSRQAEIAQAARDLANQFLMTFRAIFRMASPSLVMFDAGVDIVKGLVLGIRTAGPEVQAALRGLFTGQTGSAVTSGQQMGEAQMEALQATITANTGENIAAVRNALAGAAQAAVPAGTQTGAAFVDAEEARIRVSGPEVSSAAKTAAAPAAAALGSSGATGGGSWVQSVTTRIRAGVGQVAGAARSAAMPAGAALGTSGTVAGQRWVTLAAMRIRAGAGQLGAAAATAAKPAMGAMGKIGGVMKGFAMFAGPMLLFMLLGPQLEKIFAALMPAIQSLIDAVMPFIQAFIDFVKPLFQELMAIIVPIFQNLVAVLGPIFQNLMATLGPIFTDLMATLGPIFQTLMAALAPLIGMLGSVLVPIFQLLASVIQALAPVFAMLVGTVLTAFAEILNIIIPIFMDMVDQLLPIFMDLIEELTPLFMELVQAFIDLWSSIVSALLPVLMDILPLFLGLIPVIVMLVGTLVSQLIPVVQELAPVFIDIISLLINSFVPVIEALLPVILDLVSIFISLLIPVIQMLIPIFVPLIEIFFKIVAALLTFLIPIILKLVEIFLKVLIPIIITVIDWFTGLFNGIGDAWSKYGQPALDVIMSAFGVLMDVIKVVINIIIGYFQFWWAVIKWAWDNIGKPIFDGIKMAFDFLWSAIKVVIDIIIGYFQFWWAVVQWAWDNIGKPIFDGIKMAFDFLWSAIKVVIDIIIGYFQLWWSVVQWLWNNVGAPIIEAIKQGFENFKNNIKKVIDIIVGIFNTLWDGLQWAWDNIGAPAIEAVKTAFQKVKDFIGGIVDGIKEKWNQIVEAVKGPVKTIVDGINDWLIKPLNSVLSALGLSWEIPPINVNWGTSADGGPVGMATGGSVTGRGSGRITGRGGGRDDKIPTLLSHGEYVIKASSAKQLGLTNLNFMNNNGKFPRGGKTNGMLARGGLWDWVGEIYNNTVGAMLDQVGDWIKQGAAFAVGKVLDFGIGIAEEFSGNKFGDMLVGMLKTLKEKIKEWATGAEEKVTPDYGGDVPAYTGPDDGWAYPLSIRSTPTTYTGHQKPGARDFAAPTGTEIRAVASGRVVKSVNLGNKSYGQYIKLSHLDGIISLYAHMSKRIAEVGKNVKAGQVIGLVGSTGRSTGPHLHLEVASPQDAAAFLRRKGVKGLADGGVVRATEGGVAAILAEGGRSERVTPLDAEGRTPAEVELLTMMRDFMGKESVTVTNNIYPSPGMDERALAVKVSQEIAYLQRRRS